MRVMSNGKVRRSVAEWRAICERFSKSGLGQQEFCQREAIPGGSFKKWYQRCMTQPSALTASCPTAAFHSYSEPQSGRDALARRVRWLMSFGIALWASSLELELTVVALNHAG